MNKLKHYENIALSNHDILRLLNNKCNIILYPDLPKYNNINELLDPYNACIILYESKPAYGHWCALTKRDDDIIEFFNPYGGIPDCCLKQINLEFRKKSNQLIPRLTQLMENSPYELHYNEFKFQELGYDIKTCGRHCCIRVFCKDIDIYHYKDFLDFLCKHLDTDYDGVVTILTT
jgi:hypothetical protein